MSKRTRIILASFVSSLGFIGIQFLPIHFKYISIFGLSFVVTLLVAWALKELLEFNMTLLSLVLPASFTIGVGFLWFLLPPTLLTRFIAVLFGVLVYGLCLTTNVYLVSIARTIALLRAAKGVGFIFTLAAFILLYAAIFSFKLPIYLNSLLVFVVSIPLFVQGYWIIELEKKLSKRNLFLAISASLVCAQLAAALFFWPVQVLVGASFLTSAVYVLLGLGQAHIEERLFSQTVREYVLIGSAIFFAMFIVTPWGV
jgi:Protein of unknown function (DUF5656)